MRNKYIGLFLFFLAYASLALGQSISFSNNPKHLQLYPRSLTTNTATVKHKGAVNTAGYTSIKIVLLQNGLAVDSVSQALIYVAGNASFDLNNTIVAARNLYTFKCVLTSAAGAQVLVAQADSVVCGDVFLIQGQSNAAGRKYSGSSNADNHDIFIRAFGFRMYRDLDSIGKSINDTAWYVANGDGDWDAAGEAGQWGLRMAKHITDSTGIPVAVINGAYPGRPITYFQRNDNNPLDITTNYGRMLYRVSKAGVTNNIRAIIYYQGESDASQAQLHKTLFDSLYHDWHLDYPTLEHVYVFQVNEGCLFPSPELRDVQRQFKDNYANLDVMSSSALAGHDGCHFSYADGYKDIGNRIALLILREQYGYSQLREVEAPNIDFMYFADDSNTEINLVMRNKTDSLIIETLSFQDFLFSNAGTSIMASTVYGNKIKLVLNAPVPGSTLVTYKGHTGPNPGWVKNAAGVGALCFYNLAVRPRQGSIVLDKFPANKQFFARDNASNQAQVAIQGKTFNPGFNSLVIKLYRNGVLNSTGILPLSFNGDSALFSTSVNIPAEKAFYKVELYSFDGEEVLFASADSLLTGDAFIVNGEVNAVSRQISGAANASNNSLYVRSFGTRDTIYNAAAVNSTKWFMANGDATAIGDGAIGQWPLYFASRLCDSLNVPICIINNAELGLRSVDMLANTANPSDINTNFGRLLSRCNAAELTHKIKAVFIYQGESDSSFANNYLNNFASLHANYSAYYNNLSEFYIFQVNTGCGLPSIQLRQAQASLGSSFNNVQVLATTGLNGHNGCEYNYSQGNDILGLRMLKAVLNKSYMRPYIAYKPTSFNKAFVSNFAQTQVTLVASEADHLLTAEPLSELDFQVNGALGYLVTSIVANGNKLVLTLNKPLTSSASLNYTGHAGSVSGWIRNQFQTGVYAFYNLPIVVFDSIATLSALPKKLQLIPRNITTNYAPINFSGTIKNIGFDTLTVNKYRNNVLQSQKNIVLNYAGANSVFFKYEDSIRAELSNYGYEIILKNADQLKIFQVDSLVAGDVYLINGSTNAIANMISGSANAVASNSFVRSYGCRCNNSVITVSDSAWYIANGDGNLLFKGDIGQWALALGNELSMQNNLPIAIVNGAAQNENINFFKRNDTNPTDLNTNYGRALHRLQSAGLQKAVRGVVFFQGEYDSSFVARYSAGFNDIYTDWNSDFDQLEKIYVVQVNEGCNGPSLELRNQQRLLPNTYNNVQVLSANALLGFNGCTFAYSGGYRIIGQRLYWLMQHQLYGGSDSVEIKAPEIQSVAINAALGNQLKVTLKDNTASYNILGSNLSSFIIENGGTITVTGYAISGNNIYLNLSAAATTTMGLSYNGSSNSNQAWLMNGRGIGMLAHYNIPVLPYTGLQDIKYSAVGFSLYPNPSNNFISLTANDDLPGKTSLTVVSILGQVVWQQNISSMVKDQPYAVDISQLANGTYFLLLNNELATSQKPFIVQH